MLITIPCDGYIRYEFTKIAEAYPVADTAALAELAVEGAFACLMEEWLAYEYFDYWMESHDITEFPRVEGLMDNMLPLIYKLVEILRRCMPEQDFVEMSYSTIHRVDLIDDGFVVLYEV